MKTIKIFLILVMMTAGVISADAQSKTKIGVIKISELLELMPEYDSLKIAYQIKFEEAQRTLQDMRMEYQKKSEELASGQFTEMMRSLKVQEIKDLENRMVNYQQVAEESINKFAEEQQAPILEKIRNAIKEVAKENGFTHIIDNTSEQVVFFEDAFDILPLVKAKLNLKDKPVPTLGQ